MPYPEDSEDELVECVACGASIAPEVARAYAVSPDVYLCWMCSLERGGRFDDEEDRWVRPPDVEGLPVHP
jgi:hypothetical protein